MANRDYKKEKDSGNRKPLPKSKTKCLNCEDHDSPSYTFICSSCFRAYGGVRQRYCHLSEYTERGSTYKYNAHWACQSDSIGFRNRRQRKNHNVKVKW